MQLVAQVRNPLHAHVDDEREAATRRARASPAPPAVGCVRRHQRDAVRDAAMRDRHANGRRRREPRRDAGNDLHLDACTAQRRHLLAAATEHERVAALEPHDEVPCARFADHELLDERLRRRRAAAALADGDHARARADEFENRGAARDRRAAPRRPARARARPSASAAPDRRVPRPRAPRDRASCPSSAGCACRRRSAALPARTIRIRCRSAARPGHGQSRAWARAAPRTRRSRSVTPWQLHTTRERAGIALRRLRARHHQRRAQCASRRSRGEPFAQPAFRRSRRPTAAPRRAGRRPGENGDPRLACRRRNEGCRRIEPEARRSRQRHLAARRRIRGAEQHAGMCTVLQDHAREVERARVFAQRVAQGDELVRRARTQRAARATPPSRCARRRA